jgi:hypothetical protein
VLNQKTIKWKWIALLCLAAPLLSFVIIKPDWLARLVAVNGVFLVVTILVFNYGLNPRSRIIGKWGYKMVYKSTPQRDRITEIVGRCLIVLFGIYWLLFCEKPLICDDIQFARQGSIYAKYVEGRVAQNDTLYAAYFLKQGVLVEEDGQQTKHLYTGIFCNRIAHPRKTYRFTIAPKSGLILDFEQIPSAIPDNNQI